MKEGTLPATAPGSRAAGMLRVGLGSRMWVGRGDTRLALQDHPFSYRGGTEVKCWGMNFDVWGSSVYQSVGKNFNILAAGTTFWGPTGTLLAPKDREAFQRGGRRTALKTG